MLKRFVAGALTLGAASLTAVGWTQVAPDFKPPANVDPTIFDGWVPPVITGPAQTRPCDSNAKKNDVCAEYRYGWAERYSENFVQTQPAPLDQAHMAKIAEGKAYSQKHERGYEQYPFILESQAFAKAHMWKAALASLNAQLKVWYSSPMAYAMRADIEAALGRDDLAGKDIEAAIYWWETGRWTGVADETPYVIYSSAVRWAVRNNQSQKATDWGIKMGNEPYNSGPRALYRAAKDALEKLGNMQVASSTGLSADRVKEIDIRVNAGLTACPTDLSPFNDAIKANYKAVEAKKQLVEAAQLCGDFKRAVALWAEISANNSEPPLPNWWRMAGAGCDMAPNGLELAVASGYRVSYTALLLGDYHVRCKRPQQAARRYRQALDAELNETPQKDGAGIDTGRRLANQLALVGEYGEALDLYIGVNDYFEKKYGVKDKALHAHMTSAMKIAQDGLKSGKLKMTTEQMANIQHYVAVMNEANATAAADAKQKQTCEPLPGNAVRVLEDAANAVRAGQTPGGTVQQWENACNAIRRMTTVATDNKCATSVLRDLNRAGNIAYNNGKSYADNWKKEYLEDLHMGCYPMPDLY